MNENKRVRVFLVDFLEFLADVTLTLSIYNCRNAATEHMTVMTSVTGPPTPSHCTPRPATDTGQPSREIAKYFQGAEPLDRLRFLGCMSYPARRAQPADSDFFSRRRARCRPPSAASFKNLKYGHKIQILLHMENGLKEY